MLPLFSVQHTCLLTIKMSQEGLHYVGFGPNANCTLEVCSIEHSVYRYRPSLAANVVFIALFAIAMAIQIVLGMRWKTWWFMWCIITGCVAEIIGYAGRVMLYYNPFKFSAFMIQIGNAIQPYPSLSMHLVIY